MPRERPGKALLAPEEPASLPLALQLRLRAEGRAGCDAWLPRKDPPLHPVMHLSIKEKMPSVPCRTGLGCGEKGRYGVTLVNTAVTSQSLCSLMCKIKTPVPPFQDFVKVSHVKLFVTPWTIQSVEFSRPEYWIG